MTHSLELVPQSIADGWEAICSCGWRKFEPFAWEKDDPKSTRDGLLAFLKERFREHAAEQVS